MARPPIPAPVVRVYNGNDRDNIYTGIDGVDEIYGNGGNDILDGAGGDDKIDGGRDNDTLIGGAGDDTLIGGLGTDTADYSAATTSISADLSTGSATGSQTGTDSLSGIENLVGGSGDDMLTGDAGSNRLDGGGAADTLVGGAGDDTLIGGAGDDTIYEGEGANDVIDGGDGYDTLYLGTLTTNGSRIVRTGDSFTITSTNVQQGSMGSGSGIERIIGSALGDNIQNFSDVRAGSGNDFVFGSTSSDALYGEGDNDQISGDAGDDLIDGGSGNDTLFGDGGIDTIHGGIGDDSLLGGSEDDTLYGDVGNDRLFAGSGNNSLFGGDDNDELFSGGAGGTDILDGGDGQDTLTSNSFGHVTINGGTGNDTVVWSGNWFSNFNRSFDGGAGFDTLNLSALNAGARIEGGVLYVSNTVSGQLTSIEQIIGTAFADHISLASATSPVTIDGAGGDDTLIGGAGDDTLIGGLNDDTFIVSAGSALGSDTIAGGLGNDTFDGSNASVALRFSSSANQSVLVRGYVSGTTIASVTGVERWTGSSHDDEIFLETLTQSLVINGGGGSDRIVGGLGADEISGGDGDDAHLYGYAGDDVIDGGAGIDLIAVEFSSASSGVNFTFAPNMIVTDDHGTDTISNVERVQFTGSNFDDVAVGGAYDDTLQGWGGNDTLTGGGGNDNLSGGTGADTLRGGTGNNVLNGGDAADNIYLENSTTSFVDSFEGGDGTDTLHLAAVNGAGVTVTQDINSNFTVRSGTTIVAMGARVERIVGTEFNDRLQAFGAVTLEGGSGQDVLTGNSGDQALLGGDGTDLLDGNAGSDHLTGGAQADIFLYQVASDSNQPFGIDTIHDFNPLEDTINLSSIAQSAGGDFTLVGDTYDPGGPTRQAVLTNDGTNSTLTLHNGSSSAIFVLNIAGVHTTAQGISGVKSPPPSITISDAAATEGGTITFVVTRSGDLSNATSIGWGQNNGSAVYGTDLGTPQTWVLNFAPMQSTATISFSVIDDSITEATEAFSVTLSAASSLTTNANIIDATAIGTIFDNEPATLALSADQTIGEAAGSVTFTVTRTGDLSASSSVYWTTSTGGVGNTSGLADGYDITPVGGALSFAVGEVTKTITVPITDDGITEGTETFEVWLTQPTANAVIADGLSVVTILDDDQASSPSSDTAVVQAFSVSEGHHSYVTDGTEYYSIDTAPGEAGSLVREALGFNGSVFFIAEAMSTNSSELYRFDPNLETISGFGTAGWDLNIVADNLYFLNNTSLNVVDAVSLTVAPVEFPESVQISDILAWGDELLGFSAGGSDAGTVWAYNPAISEWREIEVTGGSVYQARAVVGKLVIGEGWDESGFGTFALNPDSGTATRLFADYVVESASDASGDLYVVARDNSFGDETLYKIAVDGSFAPIGASNGFSTHLLDAEEELIFYTDYSSVSLYNDSAGSVQTFAATDHNINAGEVFDGELYFSAHTAETGWAIYKTDQATGTISLVRDFSAGPDDLYTNVIGEVNGLLLVTADSGTGARMWTFDGIDWVMSGMPAGPIGSPIMTLGGDYLL